jgi:malonyl CoA-acyl carrier protein transacylase
MQLLHTLGCRRAIEVGPGQVLAKLVQRMRLGITSASLEEAALRVAPEVRA